MEKQNTTVRRRSGDAELWRTAFARMEQKRYSAWWASGWRASRSSGVSRAEARIEEIKGKQEVRRRSDDAELWRTAFARMEQKRYLAWWALGWRASRSSGVSRAEARKERKLKVNRRSAAVRTDAELWRTAFARMEQKRYSAWWALGWRASRSSGVSRAEAEKKES